jgi:NTP pyrophosphatase (non-canonical NTP hydrolase)
MSEIKRTQSSAVSEQPSFQKRVHGWMMDCFSMEICRDRQERNHRFLEEALELVQACGCTASEAHQLVDYVYGRDQGDINQEVGGVMVTLAALCLANDIDMHQGGEIELARILQPAIMNKIRAKQASKPKHSPLPAHPARAEPQASADSDDAAIAKQIGSYLGLYSIDTKDVAYIRGVLNEPQTVRLGDTVRINERSPYFHEYGTEMKVVSLAIDPDGKLWASVIEGSPRHRGNGVYDSEITDIDADHLSPISRPQCQAESAKKATSCSPSSPSRD